MMSKIVYAVGWRALMVLGAGALVIVMIRGCAR